MSAKIEYIHDGWEGSASRILVKYNGTYTARFAGYLTKDGRAFTLYPKERLANTAFDNFAKHSVPVTMVKRG